MELIAICAAQLAAAGWTSWYVEHMRFREMKRRVIEVELENRTIHDFWVKRVQEQMDRVDKVGLEMVDRIVALRKAGFEYGGERAPEPEPPLAEETEYFLSQLDPDIQGETRRWCLDQRAAGLPEMEIYERLTADAEMRERLTD